jgi:hypothetical protein
MRKIYIGRLVLLFAVVFTTLSCSKEEEPVPLKEFDSPSYDVGHLMIKLDGQPSIVDSIKYTNLTSGVVSPIDVSRLNYYQTSNMSLLSMALANGNSGNQVRCCVYLNTATNIGIVYEFMSSDSIPQVFTNNSVFCLNGTY